MGTVPEIQQTFEMANQANLTRNQLEEFELEEFELEEFEPGCSCIKKVWTSRA